MKYANILTGEIRANDLPKLDRIASKDGAVFGPSADQQWDYWRGQGWRKVAQIAEVPEGRRVTAYTVVEVDKDACNLTVAASVDIAEETAKAEADALTADTARKEAEALAVADSLQTAAWLAALGRLELKITREDILTEARKQLGLADK